MKLLLSDATKLTVSNVVPTATQVNGNTVDAIERIITFGLSNGYTFAPLTMDSPVVHQKVNN